MFFPEFPWLIAMGLLMASSAFFSSSEAAWFYLTTKNRRQLATGNRTQRLAIKLLENPDRLLTGILFWNLVINVLYFAITSICAIHLEQSGHAASAGIFTAGALVVMIIVAEMLPKSLAVLIPCRLVSMFAIPLSTAVGVLDPMQNALRAIETISLRTLWPRFKPEPDLRVTDLERAVELSTDDARLLEQEQRVLQAIVSLADMRVDELMRPRTRFLSFRPPVALADLGGKMPPSGYLLVTESNTEEVVAAIDLESLSNIPEHHLEHHAEPVVYVPWSTSVASALETMRARNRRVAVVVNELGETIGVFTFHDILDTIFTQTPSRTERLLKTMPIMQVGPGVWHVNGMTGLKRLARYFGVSRPESKSVTVSGVVQEMLERLPEKGDRCVWGAFHFEVIDVPERGQLLVRLTLNSDSADESDENPDISEEMKASSEDVPPAVDEIHGEEGRS